MSTTPARMFRTARGAHAPSRLRDDEAAPAVQARVPVGTSPTVAASTAAAAWRKPTVQACGEAPQAARGARALPGRICETPTLDRRSFLRLAGGFAIAAAFGPLPEEIVCAAEKKDLFSISLAEWSLNRAIFKKKLDHLDFPKTAKQDFGIDAIELVNQFFMKKAKDRKYLAEFKQRADDLGVKILLIMCDDEGKLGDASTKKRLKAVENHFKWAEAAKFFGCHSIRVNAYSDGTPDEQRDRVADGLHRLSEFGAKLGMNVIVENHGGISSRGDWLASVMRKVNRVNCGTLPDFGNFEDYDRYKAVSEMMPFAKAVSAKSIDFDAAGNCVETDYRRMLKIVLEAGYRGYMGIEYEGDKLSEPDGIRLTKRLLEKVRTELS